HRAHRVRARLMAPVPRQPARTSPPPVAVHDDGDVAWDAVGFDDVQYVGWHPSQCARDPGGYRSPKRRARRTLPAVDALVTTCARLRDIRTPSDFHVLLLFRVEQLVDLAYVLVRELLDLVHLPPSFILADLVRL